MTVWVLVMLITSAAPAHGVQHLVNPGDNWSDLAQRVRPGDEIILMPGRHRPATLNNLRGTANRPIVIRALNPDHPAIIEADRIGIRLRRPQYLEIRDVTITGATVNGIDITDEGPGRDGKPWLAHVTIRNVFIERTGPIGRRNAMRVVGLEQVRIERCRFEGWGGSAVELIGSHEVAVDRCTFTGLADFSQMNAVQVRAGSDRVRITNCVMVNPGVTGVSLGGSSDRDEFRPNLAGRANTSAPLHEATRVRVTTNIVHGGHSAVAFINCDQCIVRNNTFLRPQRWVYLILDEDAGHLAPTRRTTFGVNLIVWEPGDIIKLSHLREEADASGLTLEQNLWWSPDLAATRSELGAPAGVIQFPQVEDVDPKLDERHVPTDRRAVTFGHETP